MTTALDSITTALKELGVLASGETPAAGDAADALAALNRLIDQWAAERLQIFTVTRTTFTITSGTGAYSVAGVTGVARPVFLDSVGYIETSTTPDTEYLLQPLTAAQYASIPQKALQGTLPASWYYEPTFPTGTLSFFPVPTSTTLQGVTYAPQPAASFAGLTTAVSLPPGYAEMIITNLAVTLAASYGRQVDPSLARRAINSVAVVKRANVKMVDLSFTADSLISGRGAWSIYTGP